TAPIVAEHAFGLMLAVAKRASYQTARLKAGRWGGPDNVYLHGKTLGVVGTGAIGGVMARLGGALGMDVVAWTFHPEPARAVELGVRYLPLDELLRTADVVSLHVRLTPESRGLIGARELGLMKPGAHLVNTSRGPIVDEAALIAALRVGRIAGAGLDVFDVEPLPADQPYHKRPNSVITPHLGYVTEETYRIFYGHALEDIQAFLRGAPIRVLKP